MLSLSTFYRIYLRTRNAWREPRFIARYGPNWTLSIHPHSLWGEATVNPTQTFDCLVRLFLLILLLILHTSDISRCRQFLFLVFLGSHRHHHRHHYLPAGAPSNYHLDEAVAALVVIAAAELLLVDVVPVPVGNSVAFTCTTAESLADLTPSTTSP